jgi:3'(2'), 5'-bisphosphate nucleotidase
MLDKKRLLDPLIKLSWRASDKILSFYDAPIENINKKDGSPLTQADMASHHIICDELKALTPDIPIISEEDKEIREDIPALFWLVDPLDGTKEFINKNGEFTTNIALIENQTPVMGIICAPALQIVYAGIVGEMAFKETPDKKRKALKLNNDTSKGSVVTGSRSHGNQADMDAFLKDKKIAAFLPTGSSLKFCRIAEGNAHLYPRFGRTMEWDTAAGHAILEAAGGKVTKIDKTPLLYGKPGLDNPHFIAGIARD